MDKITCRTHFLGVLPSDQLPKKPMRILPSACIINTHPARLPGEHWIAVYLTQDGPTCFFDSFGNPPNSHRFPTTINNFLAANDADVLYSDRRVQDFLNGFPELPVALLSSVACELAPLRIVLLCVFLTYFFYLFYFSFDTCMSAMIMYDKRTLLDIGHRYTNLIKDTLSTDPAWPLEILRSTELNNDHLNNRRRRRKHRGRRAGIRSRLRKRAHSPPLPSILLANVQSLENKMDDLRARISFQRDIRDCNIFCLTETWLTPTVPDTAVTPSDNFSVLRMDRSAEAGKNKGGGVCFFINKKWCDPRNISILSRSCSPHLEHLSIICRPFYLPREFTSILVSAVYIPPQADTSVALSNLHDEISGYINKHPDAACIIAGDFNKANLKKVLPNFHQHISCPTRGLNTLDHCYTPLNNAYKAHSLPAFGKSDHVAIFLTPEYKQRIAREPPVEREVTRWSPHSEATLQASLDDVDWDMFRASSSDVSEFTDVAVSFVNTLTEQATETVTIRTFTNQKPWVDRSIRDAVNHRTAAYNAGLLSGNMSEYKTSCYALRRAIRAAKRRYPSILDFRPKHEILQNHRVYGI